MKSILFLSTIILAYSVIVTAQQPNIITERKIYKHVDSRDLYVDVFCAPQAQQKGNHPAIAFFHGGGWVFGDPSEFHGACKRYAEKGFVTFSFQYRLSINEDGAYPRPGVTLIECVKDARSAIRWMRENAESLNIDPNKIVVCGQSAGGQLAWSTALMDTINEPTDNLKISAMPEALVLYSSNYNTLEPWIDMIFGEDHNLIWAVSPYHNLRSGLPPALGFYGTNDCTVLPYIVQLFDKRMHELGNPFELIPLEGRDHYLGGGNEKYARYFDEGILEQTDEFLRKIYLMPEGR